METRSLKYIAKACGAPVLHADPETAIQRVITDSRQATRGDLFVALAGDRFDGHDFLQDVARKGAAAVIAEKSKLSPSFASCGTLAVDNSRHALGGLASFYRNDFNLPLIVVGGSNGKTTTKELLASVLSQRWSTLWSEASFNNDVGVPLTLLRLGAQHRAAVLEVGTNHPGELRPLLEMARPNMGVITSIGREHMEFFGNLTRVADEEGLIAEMLPRDGTLFINADSLMAAEIARRTAGRVLRVGLSPHFDVCASDIQVGESGVEFQVNAYRSDINGDYRIQLLGRHQVTNALLALAVAMELGMTREEIRRGLAACNPPAMRMQIAHVNGIRILDDAYNANADSMLAALQTLHDLPCDGYRMAILGDMAELGEEALPAHAEVGRRAAELKIDRIITVGKMAEVTANAARSAGGKGVMACSEVNQAAAAAVECVRERDLVLVKASRAARFERLIEALKGTKQH